MSCVRQALHSGLHCAKHAPRDLLLHDGILVDDVLAQRQVGQRKQVHVATLGAQVELLAAVRQAA